MSPELPAHLRAIAPTGAHVAAGHTPPVKPSPVDTPPGHALQEGATPDGAAPVKKEFRRDFVIPRTVPVMVRDGTTADWADIWPFFRALVARGETICLPNLMMGTDARTLWFGGPDTDVIVAVDPSDKPAIENPDTPILGRVIGSASLRTARDGHGRHVARAAFVVDPRVAGSEVEKELAIGVLTRAKAAGFEAVEIDPVVETDTESIAAWQSLGFAIVGTRPNAFEHPTAGMVGLHILYRAI